MSHDDDTLYNILGATTNHPILAALAAVRARIAALEAERDAAIADAGALYDAIHDALECGCNGVHWVDIDGDAEKEPCELWCDLDDRLRAMEAGMHPGARLVAERDAARADAEYWQTENRAIRDAASRALGLKNKEGT